MRPFFAHKTLDLGKIGIIQLASRVQEADETFFCAQDAGSRQDRYYPASKPWVCERETFSRRSTFCFAAIQYLNYGDIME